MRARSTEVLDFGISKTQEVGDPSMTRTQMVMGSPGYMIKPDVRPPDSESPAAPRVDPYGSPD